MPASAPKRFFKPLNFRSGPPDCLVEALSVPFAGLQTAQPSAAALHSTVLFKRLDPPQRRYTHCLVEGSRLQTPKLSAALHTVLLTLQGYRLRASQPLTHCLVGAAKVPAFKPLNAPQRPYTVLKLLLKTPGCQPSKASTLRSGLTHSIVGALRRLPAFRRVLSAAALHILSLGVHECRLPANR